VKLTIGRQELPRPPVEIADEVELWAREHGRHGTLHFVPTALRGFEVIRGAWVVRLSLRENDKRLLLYRQGLAPEPPTEDVWLHVPNAHPEKPIPNTDGLKEGPYVALDIVQLGAAGVRRFLEKGDTWSGRGEYQSLEQQVRAVRAENSAAREKFRADQKETSRLEQRDKRRWRFKIPFIPVSIGLKRPTERGSTP